MSISRESILKNLRGHASVGVKADNDGNLYFGELSNGRTKGWLHRVFQSAPPEYLSAQGYLNDTLKRFDYFNQLHEFNGAHTFFGALKLFGVHFGFEMKIPIMNILLANENYEESFGPGEALLFGCEEFDDSEYWCFEHKKGHVSVVDRESGEIISKWPDLDAFLSTELERISRSFSSAGQQISSLIGHDL